MRADFTYNVASWKPYVRYKGGGVRGNLTIEQPATHSARLGGNKYKWDVRLNREVPMDLNVHFGAGHAQLDLGNLNLRSVEVNMGGGGWKWTFAETPNELPSPHRGGRRRGDRPLARRRRRGRQR